MKILFQGDSVTDCGRGNSGGCGYEQGQMGPGYPGLIKSRLSCDRPDAGFEFVNLGISGNRIVDLYARWRAYNASIRSRTNSLQTGNELNNRCRLRWYEALYQDPLNSVNSAGIEPYG